MLSKKNLYGTLKIEIQKIRKFLILGSTQFKKEVEQGRENVISPALIITEIP